MLYASFTNFDFRRWEPQVKSGISCVRLVAAMISSVGIGMKVHRPKVQADLARNGPDLYLVQCGRESFIVESVPYSTELMQPGDLPEDYGGDIPFRICGEHVSFVWREASVERFDQNMSVQIQHPKQLRLKRDRPVDSIPGLA